MAAPTIAPVNMLYLAFRIITAMIRYGLVMRNGILQAMLVLPDLLAFAFPSPVQNHEVHLPQFLPLFERQLELSGRLVCHAAPPGLPANFVLDTR